MFFYFKLSKKMFIRYKDYFYSSDNTLNISFD